ncbi:Transcription factor Adf-1 [Aphelenchoides avenae]|nr:Transcription factor Adf-1 [Aphelenchus avenae]
MSVSQELRLIEAVSRRPELLRPDRSTTSTQARAVKWAEVSTEIGISEADARRTWKALRGVFKKKFRAGQPGNWAFYEPMKFMEPIMREEEAALHADASAVIDSSTDEVAGSAATESRRSTRVNTNTAVKPGAHLEAAVAKLKRAVEEPKANIESPGTSKKPRLEENIKPLEGGDVDADDDELFFRMLRNRFARMDNAAKDHAKEKFLGALNEINYRKD